MKLLFLTPQLPYPPYQGTTLRNFNILKNLAGQYEIHLLTFGERSALDGSPLCDLVTRVELTPLPRRALLQRAAETFSHPLPDMARRLASPALEQKLRALLAENSYVALQIEGIEMANAWLEARRARSPQTLRVVFDDHNAEWTLQRTAYETDRQNPRRAHAALYSRIQTGKLRAFERAVCLAADAVVAVSEPDAQALTALDARIRPIVIPNGVDVEQYVPSDAVCAKPLAEWSLVFTGKMDFRPNIDAAVWFARDILPRVRQHIPLAHIVFVGQKPAPAVTALNKWPGVEVTGMVPDTRPYIADAAVYVVPLRMGSGTRLKMLEAMAMGKAIVSTSFGAAGIECVNEREVLIADTAQEFADAVVSLLRDRARAQQMGARARQLAVEKYDWRQLAAKFDEIYKNL